MRIANLLAAAGDPIKTREVLGFPAPVAEPGAAPSTLFQVHNIPGAAPVPLQNPDGLTYPAGDKSVALNVDRPAIAPAAAASPSVGSAQSVALAPAPAMMPAASWLTWVKAHWPWLVAALVVLLIVAYAGKGKGRASSGFSPSPVGKRIPKGSAEAKEHMARLRAMKRKG